jgi:hypothetical protein
MQRDRSIVALPSATVIACTGQIRSHFLQPMQAGALTPGRGA